MRLETDFGLTVLFDGVSDIEVLMPSRYRNGM